MAPVCVARRLILQSLCVFILFASLGVQHVDSLLVYERQSLLDLQLTVKFDHGGPNTSAVLQLYITGVSDIIAGVNAADGW